MVLTEREREIVLLLSEGLTNKAIGGRLGLTEGTVKVKLVAIYKKLGPATKYSNNRVLVALHAKQILAGDVEDFLPAPIS